MTRPAKLFLLLAAGLLLVSAGLYRSEIPPEAVEADYADGDSRFARIDGVRVHYKDEGNGPALLLIHGTGSSLHTWDGWAAELGGDFRLIRPDLSGFGLTGPDPTGDYSAARRVEILAGLLAELGVGRCSVAGNSLGGHLAMQLALTHPERVERLILVDPAGYPRRRQGGWTVLDLGRLPLLRHLFARLTPRFLVARALREAYGDPSRVTPGLIDRHYRLLRRRGNREALLTGLSTESTLDVDALRSARQPVLLLWGARDRLISVEMAPSFQRDLPSSELIVYDRLGHVPMEEDPETTARDARDFLLGG